MYQGYLGPIRDVGNTAVKYYGEGCDRCRDCGSCPFPGDCQAYFCRGRFIVKKKLAQELLERE